MKKNTLRHSLLLLLTAAIWGFAFVAQSVGMDYVQPFTFTAARSLIGGIVLLPFIFIRAQKTGRTSEEKSASWKQALPGGIICGVLLCIASNLQQIGIQYTTVGKSGFITAMYIVLVPVLGILFHKKTGIRVWISVALAVCGLYLLCMTGGSFRLQRGDLYTLCCALMFSLQILAVDSVAALVPKAEIDGDMGDSHVGLQARLMSQALRKLTPVVSKNNCVVIFINQLREKVGVMFGNPETTTGGRALKFYASVRMDVRRIETLKQGGEVIGNRTRVKVVKNKVAPPFKEAEFDIMFGKGISAVGDILDLAANVGIVQKSGAWFAYNENKIGQGRENAKQFLTEHPDMLAEIDEKVRAHYGIGEEKEDSEAEPVDKKEKAAKTAKQSEPEV